MQVTDKGLIRNLISPAIKDWLIENDVRVQDIVCLDFKDNGTVKVHYNEVTK